MPGYDLAGWRFLRREGLSSKKVCSPLNRPATSWPASGRSGRPSSAVSKRTAWCSSMVRRTVAVGRESRRTGSRPTWPHRGAGRRRANASRGVRVPQPLAHHDLPGRAALGRTERPLRLRQSDQQPLLFQAWVEQFPVPTHRPGDIVILDNLASHKERAVRQAIRTADARLWFLTAYSPDLNPIEQTFAKSKHWMRDAQKRSIEDTWRQLGSLIDTIKPAKCQKYIRNDGYGSNENGYALVGRSTPRRAPNGCRKKSSRNRLPMSYYLSQFSEFAKETAAVSLV